VLVIVGDCHLLDDLLEIFIGYLNNTIHLGSIRRRIKVFNLLLSAELSNQLSIKVLSIVSYHCCWQGIAKKISFLMNLLTISCVTSARVGMYPLNEAVYGHQDEPISIASL